MNNIFSIKNEHLEISVRETGAELCGIKLLEGDKDYMWNANPEIWAGYSPVLFPIIGALKEDSYLFKGKQYSLPRHGFIRNNTAIKLKESTANSLNFQLSDNPDTIELFPFHFEFLITYTLSENRILIDHKVRNTGKKEMYFSLGGHPAFRCPINKGENFSDYYIEFSQNEKAYTYQIEDNGLIGEKTDLILDNSRIINLHYKLFDKGALVFKDLRSKQASLISRISGKRIQVDYEGFPYLGIWAKQNADYVCIEPWLGIADSVDTNQQIESKEGIICLAEEESYDAGYSISIF